MKKEKVPAKLEGDVAPYLYNIIEIIKYLVDEVEALKGLEVFSHIESMANIADRTIEKVTEVEVGERELRKRQQRFEGKLKEVESEMQGYMRTFSSEVMALNNRCDELSRQYNSLWGKIEDTEDRLFGHIQGIYSSIAALSRRCDELDRRYKALITVPTY
jgi:predicted nuclease with TOPRIM domain